MNAGVRTALILAFVGTMAVGTYFGARAWQESRQAFERIPVGGCVLVRGHCSQVVGGEPLTLSISPEKIPLMQTLSLRVGVGSRVPEGVAVEIRGLNMDMGLNRTLLRGTGDGGWVGETILPICSQRRMEWEAAVQLDGEQRIEVPFSFQTTRP